MDEQVQNPQNEQAPEGVQPAQEPDPQLVETHERHDPFKRLKDALERGYHRAS